MINKNTARECLIFTFERLWEEENLFKILFVEPITFQGQEIHYLAIPKDNLRPIRSYLTEVLQAGHKYEFSAGANSQLTSEYGHLNWEGKSFELKPFEEKEDQATITDEEKNNNSPEDSSQQPKTSIKQSELERVAFTVERIRGYSDSSNAFRIHFTEEIEYQTTKVKGLAISKTQSGENLSKKLQILEAGEKFEIIIAGAGLAVNQGPGFSYLEATLDNIREIRKLGTEASSPASNAETSQKVRTNKATNPTLAKQNLAPDNNWFGSGHWLTDQEIDWALEQVVTQLSSPSKFKILELTQFMFAKETLDSNDPAARFSFPVLLSELTGFNGNLVFIPINNPDFHWSLLVYELATKTFYHWDTLRGNPNHGYIKPLVKDLLQQLHQNNKVDLEKYLILRSEIIQPNTWDCGIAVIEITKRIMERYEGSLEGINLGVFDFPQARINWRSEYENESTWQRTSHEETPDGEVSSNRYATVESEEEEISDWSDDESLVSTSSEEWTAEQEAKFSEWEQKHQALIAEQKEVGKLLDSVEKDRAEGKLSQTQIQEKVAEIRKRHQANDKTQRDLLKEAKELGIVSDSEDEEESDNGEERSKRKEELEEQIYQLFAQDLTYSELTPKINEIKAEFAKLKLNLEFKERKEGEKTRAFFSLSRLPTQEEEKAMVLASTSQTSEVVLTQLFARRLEREIDTVLAETPAAVTGPLISAEGIRSQGEEDWKKTYREWAKSGFSSRSDQWFTKFEANWNYYAFRYIPGVNIAGTLFENLSGEDLWEKKLRAEGKISDKKLVELIVEKAQDREYEIVAHQKDLIRALKKIRRGYGDIVKAQKYALELKDKEIEVKDQQLVTANKKVEDKEKEVETSKEELKKNKEMLGTYEKAGKQLQEDLKNTEKEKGALTTKTKELDSELDAVKNSLKTTEEQKNKLSTQIQNLNQQITNWKDQAEAWELQKEDIGQQINQKNQTITDLQHEVDLLQAEVNNYQEKAIEVAERLKKNRTLVSPEKASLEELRKECSELQKERQSHLVWIGALQVEIKNKTQRLNTLKTDAEALKQEAANLGKILCNKRTEILKLVKKLNKLENDMTNLEQELREEKEKVQQLESEKQQLEEWLQQAREEREDVRSQLTKQLVARDNLLIEKEKEIALQKTELGEKRIELQGKETQLNEKDGIIAERDKIIEWWDTKDKQNVETIKNLGTEVRQLESENTELKFNNDQLNADNHRLTTELREKTEELRNAIRAKKNR